MLFPGVVRADVLKETARLVIEEVALSNPPQLISGVVKS
jgi:hypothetical protein